MQPSETEKSTVISAQAAFIEAADGVRQEARWQMEMKLRRLAPPTWGESIARLQQVETILRDRAERIAEAELRG